MSEGGRVSEEGCQEPFNFLAEGSRIRAWVEAGEWMFGVRFTTC